MQDKLSRLATVFEELGLAITNYTDKDGVTPFEDIPVFWDMVELSVNTMPPTCIVFSAKEWQNDKTHCHIERQIDICIIHNTDYAREITLRLTNYSETLKDIIDEVILTSNIDLTFVNGSPIGYLKNVREDSESYKGSKTLFSSIIILSYLLRY